jgi:hypothetical protein
LLIEAEPRVREAWLTEARRTALEAWPHGGAFTLAQGYAAWRVPGLLSVARVEELLRHLAEARRMLE